MPPASIPYVLMLGFLFGSTLLVSRFSVGQYAPANYVGLRLLIAAAAHALAYALIRSRTWPRNRTIWMHGAVLGIFGTAIPMTSIVTSLQFQSSGLTSILLTIGPAITVVFAHFALPDEKLTGRKIAGVVLAFSGAILLALLGENGLPDVPASATGYLLVVFAMIMGSGATVYVRRFLKDADGFDLASIRMVFAAITLAAYIGLVVGLDLSRVTAGGYLALLYAALTGTFLGMILSIYIIQRFGATPAAMTAYVIPVITSIGGLIFLNEQITPGMLGGMALIALGITIINRKGRLTVPPVQG